MRLKSKVNFNKEVSEMADNYYEIPPNETVMLDGTSPTENLKE